MSPKRKSGAKSQFTPNAKLKPDATSTAASGTGDSQAALSLAATAVTAAAVVVAAAVPALAVAGITPTTSDAGTGKSDPPAAEPMRRIAGRKLSDFQEFDMRINMSKAAVLPDGAALTEAVFRGPYDCAFDSASDSIFVADHWDVRRYDFHSDRVTTEWRGPVRPNTDLSFQLLLAAKWWNAMCIALAPAAAGSSSRVMFVANEWAVTQVVMKPLPQSQAVTAIVPAIVSAPATAPATSNSSAAESFPIAGHHSEPESPDAVSERAKAQTLNETACDIHAPFDRIQSVLYRASDFDASESVLLIVSHGGTIHRLTGPTDPTADAASARFATAASAAPDCVGGAANCRARQWRCERLSVPKSTFDKFDRKNVDHRNATATDPLNDDRIYIGFATEIHTLLLPSDSRLSAALPPLVTSALAASAVLIPNELIRLICDFVIRTEICVDRIIRSPPPPPSRQPLTALTDSMQMWIGAAKAKYSTHQWGTVTSLACFMQPSALLSTAVAGSPRRRLIVVVSDPVPAVYAVDPDATETPTHESFQFITSRCVHHPDAPASVEHHTCICGRWDGPPVRFSILSSLAYDPTRHVLYSTDWVHRQIVSLPIDPIN